MTLIIDGYNLLPYLTGKSDRSPREEFFYVDDDGRLVALRYQHALPGRVRPQQSLEQGGEARLRPALRGIREGGAQLRPRGAPG